MWSLFKNELYVLSEFKPRSLLWGNNNSLHAKTYVKNVCGAACSICIFSITILIMSAHHSRRPELENRERHRKEDNASTRVSAKACKPLTFILAVKNVLFSSRIQLSLFLRVIENKKAWVNWVNKVQRMEAKDVNQRRYAIFSILFQVSLLK